MSLMMNDQCCMFVSGAGIEFNAIGRFISYLTTLYQLQLNEGNA
jgi:hypothetical protein